MLSFGAVDGTLRSNRPLLALRAARSDCFRFPAGQNAPPDRFVSPASSPVRISQKHLYVKHKLSVFEAPPVK